MIFDSQSVENACFIGMVLVLLCLLPVLSSGVKGVLNIASISVGTIWIQYHLSVWMYRFSGVWDSWILREEGLPTALFYSNYAMTLILLGYWSATTYSKPKARAKALGNQPGFQTIIGREDSWTQVNSKSLKCGPDWPLPMDRPQSVVRTSFLAGALALLAILLAGADPGFENLIFSSVYRGELQWIERDSFGQLIRQLKSLSLMFGAAATIYVTVALDRMPEQQKVAYLPILILVIAGASSSLWWKFSRLAGGFFMVASLILLMLPALGGRNRRWSRTTIVIATFLFTMGAYQSFIGISHRQLVMPGLGNFFLSAIEPKLGQFSRSADLIPERYTSLTADSNVLDSSASFTAFVIGNGGAGALTLDSLRKLLIAIQPLPSFLLDEAVRVGRNIREILGISRNIGLTTPALAEIYVLVGYWGGAIFFFIGRVSARAERLTRQHKVLGLISAICLLVSIVISGHSQIRAAARFAVVAVVLIYVVPIFFKSRQIRPIVPRE